MKSEFEMEAIMNLTYPGLRLLYRDVNLRAAQANYAQGMLLRDGRDICASALGGGIVTTHRYAILSNSIQDCAKSEQDEVLGLCFIRGGAHFKVLDVYKKLGKTQITLLHLPEAHWLFFEDVTTNVDDLLVEYTRKRFDVSVDAELIEALNEPEWRKRCRHPIGMTDLGVPLPLTDDE